LQYRYWGDHNVKGQGGTAIFSKIKPLEVVYGIHNGAPDLSQEASAGRCVTLEFENCYLIGTCAFSLLYFPYLLSSSFRTDTPTPSLLVPADVPNAGANLKSLEEKKAWNRAFERYLRELDAKKPVVWTGDMNVVPTEKGASHIPFSLLQLY
jgi:AP endonuclease-1